MKKFVFYLLGGLLAIWVVACKKDSAVDYQQLDDEALAETIANDRGKQETNPSDLPAEIIQYVSENNFESYIDAAYFAEGKGYDVVLATDEHVYFNLDRRALRHRLNDRIGLCGRLMGGVLIPIDSLRPAIVEYIHTHYPDANILRAKRQGDRVIVLISGHRILVFTAGGVFELDGIHWVDCRPCAPGGVVDLPASVTTFIQTGFPGAEVKRVCRRGDRIVIGIFADDHRHILVFDKDWNFLFTIP